MTTIRAIADKKFIRRYLFVALICLGFVLYCLYDGLIAYPRQLERAQIYESLEEEEPEKKLRDKMWRDLALDKGWSLGLPDPAAKIQNKIVWQYIMAAIGLAVGLPMLVWYWRTRGTWIETTKTGLRNSSGQTLDFKQVLAVDKKKWQKKGIAKIQYDDAGTQRIFTLDDFKFQREPIDEMLRIVEANLKPDQIIGGRPEPPLTGEDAAAD